MSGSTRPGFDGFIVVREMEGRREGGEGEVRTDAGERGGEGEGEEECVK